VEDAIAWLTAWYNLIYLFALAVAAFFSLLQVFFGLLPDAIDVEVDVDGDGDLDLDVDLDIADDVGDHATFIGNAMAFLGFGKAPLTILALTFLMIFGIVGLVSSAVVKMVVIVPVMPHLVNFFLVFGNLIAAAVITGRLARFLNALLPGHSTVTRKGAKEVGAEGEAASTITEKGGQVLIGPSRWVDAVTGPGRPEIPKGSPVMLVDYDKENLRYTAERMR
jgi:membrane protein implicated in regulation of membrane protease activity